MFRALDGLILLSNLWKVIGRHYFIRTYSIKQTSANRGSSFRFDDSTNFEALYPKLNISCIMKSPACSLPRKVLTKWIKFVNWSTLTWLHFILHLVMKSAVDIDQTALFLVNDNLKASFWGLLGLIYDSLIFLRTKYI